MVSRTGTTASGKGTKIAAAIVILPKRKYGFRMYTPQLRQAGFLVRPVLDKQLRRRCTMHIGWG